MMHSIFKYLDLPVIPFNLLNTLEEVQQQKNIYDVDFYFYKQFDINDALNNYLKTIFNFKFTAQYQIIRYGIPIHKDRARLECINYLIDNGGPESCLEIYDEDKKSILLKEHIENYKWHWINVSKFHGVSGLKSKPRFSLSITPLV
jgi:hypothetical protein